MARLTSTQTSQKWARNLGNATEDIKVGVQRVSVAPGQLAAQQQDLLIQRFTEAVRSGKWAANVSAVSLAEWQKAFIEKGLGRIASGATAAMPKMEAFMREFLPFVDNVQATVRAMPKASLEDRLARMTANARALHDFRRSR